MRKNPQGAARCKPEADHDHAVRLVVGFMASALALAVLLGWAAAAHGATWTPAPASVPSAAPAPSAPPSAAAPNPSSAAPAAECTTCYLGPAHDAYYRAYLDYLSKKLGSATPPVDPKVLATISVDTTRTANAAERSAAADERTAAVVEKSAAASDPANWVWTLGAALGGAAIVQTGESSTPWLTRAEPFAQVLDPQSQLGIRVGVGVGPWSAGSGNDSAMAVGGHFAGVAEGDFVGLSLGADLTHLGKKDGAPGALLGSVVLAPEVHGGWFFARALLGLALKTEDPRTSGLILGLGVGFRTDPEPTTR